MPSTIYCYHCGTSHPMKEMRQIETKGNGKKWRCIKSIEAAQRSVEARDAFGRKVSAINKAEAQAKLKMRNA